MILLEEATTDQLIEELTNRSEYMALLVSKPNNEGEFFTAYKGSYIQKMGMVHLLKTEMQARELHNQFEYLNDDE